MPVGAFFRENDADSVLGDRGPLLAPGEVEELEPLRGFDEDITVTVPELGTDMTVPAGETTFTIPVAMRMRKFSVDLPASVSLDIHKDGGLFFSSPGDEAGEREYLDNPVPVKNQLRLVFDNQTGADAQARVEFIGPSL